MAEARQWAAAVSRPRDRGGRWAADGSRMSPKERGEEAASGALGADKGWGGGDGGEGWGGIMGRRVVVGLYMRWGRKCRWLDLIQWLEKID